MRTPLDMYDDIPREMKAYLRNYGFHFNKKSVADAIRGMRKLNASTGKLEKIEQVDKSSIEELMRQHDVKFDNNVGYDFVYYFHQAKADLFGAVINDDRGLCQYVGAMINDPDMEGGNAFRHYLVDLDAKGIGADWEDWL